MIEVELKNSDDFLKIMETLTRIGIAVEKDDKKVLYQSCHILHKKEKYYIVHFKEMFALDGKYSNMDEVDFMRVKFVAKLLQDWNLLTVTDSNFNKDDVQQIKSLKIIPYSDKANWNLVQKYTIGK